MDIKFELKNVNEDEYFDYIRDLNIAFKRLTTYNVFDYWTDHGFEPSAAFKKLGEYNDEPHKQAELFIQLIIHDLNTAPARWLLYDTTQFYLFPVTNEDETIYLVTATWKAKHMVSEAWNKLTTAAKLIIEVL